MATPNQHPFTHAQLRYVIAALQRAVDDILMRPRSGLADRIRANMLRCRRDALVAACDEYQRMTGTALHEQYGVAWGRDEPAKRAPSVHPVAWD